VAALRLALVWALVAVLVVLGRPTAASLAAGIALVAAGEALRLWAAGHLVKNVELVTSGPYRFTRNPLYLGRLAIFTGLAVMARLPHGASWLVLACGVLVFFGYYLPRKERVEPARLQEIHGASYERYRRAVPALLPAWRGYAAGSAARWSAARALRNREHWMVAGLAATVAVFAWRVYSAGDP
jgi:protein-S-isoprenylcysteine O-methyltransferase Ste14